VTLNVPVEITLPPKYAPPCTERRDPGVVVPTPRLPFESMVIFAESDGPIWVEFAILFITPNPKAEAPEAEAVLPYPIAVEKFPEAVFENPKVEAADAEDVLRYPTADEKDIKEIFPNPKAEAP
jgi:hypothetical protein